MLARTMLACLLGTALGTPAWAQAVAGNDAGSRPAPAVRTSPVADQASVGGEIIVTAQKRSERLSDVPISITAATGAKLAALGVTAPSDLVKVVPGMTYRPSDYGTPVFYIRGVGFNDIAVAVAPAVSVYVDQVPLPYLAMTEGAAFDLARVEVLKGPQGTLFGQNSTGGAINFIAAKPTRDLEAGLDLTYGRFNEMDIQGFVSGPVSNTVTGRLAVRHEGRDGWQISETRPDDRLGVRDFTDARMILDWAAADNLKFEFNVNGWKDRSDTLASQFVSLAIQSPPPAGATDTPALIAALYKHSAPNNARIADWGAERPTVLPSYIGQSQMNSYRRNDGFFQFSLRGDLQLSDDIALTSITAYSQFTQHAPIDSDGTAVNDFGITLNGSIKSFSQELRLDGKSGPLHWMVGGNYARNNTIDDQKGDYYGSNTDVFGTRYSTFVNANQQMVRTASVFASTDYEIISGLTARGSARYTDHRDEFNGCLRDSGDGQLVRAFVPFLAAPVGPGSCVTLDPTTFLAVSDVNSVLHEHNTSWRGGLDWKINSQILLYTNVTKGYKAGSYPTVPGLVPAQFAPVKQESVTAYEAGLKLSALDHKIDLTVAGFYYNYDGKQIVGYVTAPVFGNVPALVQIPHSVIKGFELGLVGRAAKGLTLTGGATYVHSRVTSDFNTNDPFGNVVDVKGEQLPITPEWQLTGDIDYHFGLTSSLDMAFGADARYQSWSPAAFGDAAGFKIPGYAVVDLRGELQSPSGKWKAQIWGRNIFNKFYLNSISHVTDTVSRTVGMPSTYGVTVSFRL